MLVHTRKSDHGHGVPFWRRRARGWTVTGEGPAPLSLARGLACCPHTGRAEARLPAAKADGLLTPDRADNKYIKCCQGQRK